MISFRSLVSTPGRLAIAVVVAGVSVTAAASLAAAAPVGDPPGANGTVKIDGAPLDGRIDNEPHVTCEFAVNFFGFDEGEHANIVFTVHPPTGNGDELLRLDDVLISDDAAGGGAPDPDEVFPFSAADLGLDAYTPHPQQGFHVKLTVETTDSPGIAKHKVFWIQPCPAPTPTPSPSPTPSESPSESPSPTPSETPSESPTPSVSPTPSETATPSDSPTPSDTPTPSETATPTESTSSAAA